MSSYIISKYLWNHQLNFCFAISDKSLIKKDLINFKYVSPKTFHWYNPEYDFQSIIDVCRIGNLKLLQWFIDEYFHKNLDFNSLFQIALSHHQFEIVYWFVQTYVFDINEMIKLQIIRNCCKCSNLLFANQFLIYFYEGELTKSNYGFLFHDIYELVQANVNVKVMDWYINHFHVTPSLINGRRGILLTKTKQLERFELYDYLKNFSEIDNLKNHGNL